MSAIPFTALHALPSRDRAAIPEILDRFLGPTMFYFGLAALVLTAGVLHRLSHGDLTAFEANALRWGMLLLWPVFVLEGLLRLAAGRRPNTSWPRRLAAFIGVCLVPPMRLAGRAYADPNKIWLPGWGWTTVDHHLRDRLERLICVPMLVVALLVLPFLALEYFWQAHVRGNFALSLALDIGAAVIWLAFALELIVMASLAEDRLNYCLHHWMDLAVVMLPLIDFLPILRLLRLTGLVEVQQVGRLGRLYRLKSLLAKFWRAILLLEMFQRLFGNHRAQRLVRLKKLLTAREEEVNDLRQEIAALEGVLTHESPEIPGGS